MPAAAGDEVELVRLKDGPALAVRTIDGPLRPFLLVPGIGPDTLWPVLAARLATAGHRVVVVDLRGHGRSEAPPGGYDVDTCADDLATLLEVLHLSGARAPLVAGHGAGASVALSLAARRDGVAGLACVDGGWLRPAAVHAGFEDWWTSLPAGPAAVASASGSPPDDASGRDLSLARSVYGGEPRAWYPLVGVPAVLCPVVPPDGVPDPGGRAALSRAGIAEAAARLPRARVSWYYGDPDVVVTAPAKLVDDLLALAADAEP